MVSKVRNVRLGVFSGGGCHHPNNLNFQIVNGLTCKSIAICVLTIFDEDIV